MRESQQLAVKLIAQLLIASLALLRISLQYLHAPGIDRCNHLEVERVHGKNVPPRPPFIHDRCVAVPVSSQTVYPSTCL